MAKKKNQPADQGEQGPPAASEEEMALVLVQPGHSVCVGRRRYLPGDAVEVPAVDVPDLVARGVVR